MAYNRGVLKVDLICRQCKKHLALLKCVIDRDTSDPSKGLIRFTSTTVDCCNLKTYFAVHTNMVEMDTTSFDSSSPSSFEVSLCSPIFKIYEVKKASEKDQSASRLGLPEREFHHLEGYHLRPGVNAKSRPDIPSPVDISCLLVSVIFFFFFFKLKNIDLYVFVSDARERLRVMLPPSSFFFI